MTTLPKYVSAERDRHGHKRYRFRRDGLRIVMKSRDPSSDAFRDEYETLASAKRELPIRPAIRGPKDGTIEWLANAYQASPKWADLAPATKLWQAHTLRRINAKHGTMPAEDMTAKLARQIRSEFNEKGIKAIRTLWLWAIEDGRLDDHPFRDVKPFARKGDGYRPWKMEHVRQFAEYHPKGTLPYLALAIFLFTGLRRGDACRLGPQHVADDGWITLETEKTVARQSG